MINFKSILLTTVKTATVISVSLVSHLSMAHERFIVPSHTLLSGEKAQSVTVIASISNDIFHPDRPLGDSDTGADVGRLKDLFKLLNHSVVYPDGSQTKDTKWQAFSRMSVADVEIKQQGTHRIGLIQPDAFMTTFKKKDGSPARLFGKSPAIPNGATDIVRRTTSSRVETFVTLNNINNGAVAPTGAGLELGGATHPNDLFSEETAKFQLFYNGNELAIPAKVKVIKAGTRHRNDRNGQELIVDENGKFTFTPTSAGFYFLAAETKQEIPQPADVDVKHYSLYLTLEVFPQ